MFALSKSSSSVLDTSFANKFVKDVAHFVKRCERPDKKEFIKVQHDKEYEHTHATKNATKKQVC